MKNTYDVSKHHQNKEINLLVKQIINDDYTKENIITKINMIFVDKSARDKKLLLKTIMERCYKNIYGSKHTASIWRINKLALNKENYFPEQYITNSFVAGLFNFITGIIEKHNFELDSHNCFNNSFYEFCLNKISKINNFSDDNDTDLLIIYLKQFVTILKSAGILKNQDGKAVIIRNSDFNISIYNALFLSYWNKVKWEKIFPSMPDAARELKKNRSILVDLMINRSGNFSIQEIVNDFFEFTGFGKKDDLILISFFDFYFFTWLKHFGLVKYISGGSTEPVLICLSEFGRIFFKGLQGL